MDPDPGPENWTRTQKSLDPEQPGSWKTWKTAGCKKKIERPHSIIYYNIKILQEETCKQTIWKNSYWGFSRIQETCLNLRVKVDSKAINN